MSTLIFYRYSQFAQLDGGGRQRGRIAACLTLLTSLLVTACGGNDDGFSASSGATEPEGAEPVSNESSSLLNTNNEYLLYGSRYTASSTFRGDLGTFFADVTGDGKADAIAVNNDRIYVRRANASGGFDASEQWTSVPFWGALGTFFADVTGDGKADAIADDPGGIVVWPANTAGTAFTPTSGLWSPSGISGTHGTFFADVTGDGKADAIAVNDDRVYVGQTNSASTRFLTPVAWTNIPYYGSKLTAFADVTGDGKADAIGVNEDRAYVKRSTGTSFSLTTEPWSAGPFYGNVATAVADVTADGLADLIAVNTDGSWVQRSNRFHFGRSELLADQTNVGTPYFADMSGDKRADQIEVNSSGLQVSKSRTRSIKLRFIQFADSTTTTIYSATDITNALATANSVYAPAGLSFRLAGSTVVNSEALGSISTADESQVPTSVLRLAKDDYNANCDISGIPFGYIPSLDLHMSEMWQLNWVATRCALPGEIVVFVADIVGADPSQLTDNMGFLPDYGKTAFLNRYAITPNGWTLSHELGHVLGLDHPWSGLATDPQTGEWGKRSLTWDLVYVPLAPGNNLIFRSREEAAAYEADLWQVSANGSGNRGWFCPDMSVPGCPANAPLGTFTMNVENPFGNGTWYSTNDEMMAGMTQILPDRRRTINVMNYNENNNLADPTSTPAWIDQRLRAISESQIEHIHRILTFNMKTVVTYANGNPVWANRQLLGRF